MAAEESVESSAKALLSIKEGSVNALASPNRRGVPPRIRRKNQRYHNDDEQTSYSPARSPKKQAKSSTPSKTPVLSAMNKRLAQSIGVRLRNLLKLPKAHKWVCYEWFYSNLDAPLFLGENDFCICLRESFPELKTKKLNRIQWNKIRRLMGKPRRCSPAFFLEERAVLAEKRDKMRLLQQRKLNEFNNLKDLPEEIPLHLTIGTKVTARLRQPQDGLFTGTIEALDTNDNSYRVIFDRPGLGTHSIPDIEVLSNEPPETIPLSAFQHKQRPRLQNLFSPPRFIPSQGSPSQHLQDNDPLLSGSPFRGRLLSLDGGTYGGFPIRFLVLVTRLSKILTIKKDWIQQVKDMNTQAEKSKSYQQPITVDFQRKYANIVLELDKLNKDLNEYLMGVQEFCQEMGPPHGVTVVDQPSEIKRKCDDEAQELVTKICRGMFSNKKTAKNENVLSLVSNLTSLMLQIRTFTQNDFNSFEFKSLQDTLSEIKSGMNSNNINSFQNNVEIHINHIQSGLTQMGNLSAFSNSLAE